MCSGASTEPSSSARTAADHFDWSHMAFIRGSSHQVFWCVLSRGQDCLPDSHSNSSTLVWSLSPWEQQHRRHSDFQTNSDSAAKCSKSGHYWWKEAGLPVKLSDGLTTSTSLCLTRSLFSKDVLDKVVTRSFCMVNPSRAGSNYRLHWASRMQQTLTAPFFEGSLKEENECQNFQGVVLWCAVSSTYERTFPKPLVDSFQWDEVNSIAWSCPLPRNHCSFNCEWCSNVFITLSLFAVN